MELLLGAGAARDRRLRWSGHEGWRHLVTVDHSDAHRPDVVCDLETPPYPFADESVEEIHAYEVLEHLGDQGDWRTFFAQFSELWRLLVPYGFLAATVPADGPGVWGDPSHRRVINRMTLAFLNQEEYVRQIGVTRMTDFRPWYKADFQAVHLAERLGSFEFVLQAMKPARGAA